MTTDPRAAPTPGEATSAQPTREDTPQVPPQPAAPPEQAAPGPPGTERIDVIHPDAVMPTVAAGVATATAVRLAVL